MLSTGDEHIMLKLCNDHLFSSHIFESLPYDPNDDSNYLEVLKRFGFCVLDPAEGSPSSKAAADAKQSLLRTALNSSNSSSEGPEAPSSPSPQSDAMLPLKQDWFFRPLFYITGPDAHLQLLAQSITRYICNSIEAGTLQDCLLIGCDELIYLLSYLVIVSDYQGSQPTPMDHLGDNKKTAIIFTPETKLRYIQALLDKIILKSTGGLNPKPIAKGWLVQNYGDIFSQAKYFERISEYLNQNSLDQNPLVYKVFIFALLARDSSSNLLFEAK